MKRKILGTLFSVSLFFLPLSSGQTQENSPLDSVLVQARVSLSALAEPHRVPLNRTVTFTVRISWEGDLDLIEIGDVEEPVLSNFDIVGTSTANSVVEIHGNKNAVKEIMYTLRPKTLGMGYIESVGLQYEDKTNGKTHALKTQRVGVEVIAPVPDSDKKRGGWIFIVAGGIIFAGCLGIFLLYKKRAGTKEKVEENPQILEEAFLKELKDTVNLKGKDRRESFTILSKLFRKYLSEKFGFSALEATTEQLLRFLESEGIEESIRRKCETLFRKADVVKFSGQEAAQSELEEAYTAVESIFESHMAQAKEQIRKAEEERLKKRKKWKGLKV